MAGAGVEGLVEQRGLNRVASCGAGTAPYVCPAASLPGAVRLVQVPPAVLGRAPTSSKVTTVRQVAREAGIADGTIYLYFDSKQELLLALLGQLSRVGERPADFAELAGAEARA